MASPRELYQYPSSMEPMLPSGAGVGALGELAGELMRQSAALGASLHPTTRDAVAALLRVMNSYYSNLIEGHHTRPLDIERALRQDFSAQPELRALQVESLAHVQVQQMIEARLAESPETAVCSEAFLCWIHEAFYERMPEEFQRARTRSGREDLVIPGQLRTAEVEVGAHTPPFARSLPLFLKRFAEVYTPSRLNPLRQLVAAAAAHHRLAWIHPFLDGNGRVCRLFTHAYLTQCKVDGHGLWMISRGMARQRNAYFAALASADLPRQGDLDGRGNLSEKGLRYFCTFFLQTAIGQVQFMAGLLELDSLQKRLVKFADLWTTREDSGIEADGLARLLSDLFTKGGVARGDAPLLLQKPERTARRVIAKLLDAGLIASSGPRDPLRMAFPMKWVGYYFPRLFPEGVELDMEG